MNFLQSKRIAGLAFAAFALCLLAGESAFGQHSEPVFAISADRLTADTGDVITFTIKQELNGTKLDRREFTLDGYPVNWKIGKHQWKATPGTHVLRLYLRWNRDGRKIHQQRYVTVQISGAEKKGGFNHPGLSISGADLDIIKANVNGDAPHPMKRGLGSIEVDSDYAPHALKEFNMHESRPKKGWDNDSRMIRTLALRWAIMGDEKAADKAVEIMMDWANTCENLMLEDQDVYQFLHVTNVIDGFLEGAEILKNYHGGYVGWSKADRNRYDTAYVRKVLVPLALGWQGNIGNPFATQNQPLNVAKARIMLGIYLDDEALFEDGREHLLKARLTSNKYETIYGHNPISLLELSIGVNGEYMEINRDEGHMGMCVGTTQVCAEILWNQGIDLYGMKFHDDTEPRLLKGLEWLTQAAYDGAPSSKRGQVKLSRGRIGNVEKMYNHYQHRLKAKYPLSKTFVDHVIKGRQSGSSGQSTLMYSELSASREESAKEPDRD